MLQQTNWSGHGIRITHAVAEFEDARVHRGASDDDMVRLHFGVRGDYSVRYPELGRSYDLVGGHHNVLYSRPFDLEFINKTTSLETFGVQFPVAQFVSYVDGATDLLSRFCERIANGGNGILFEEWAPMNPAIDQTIRQIVDCRYAEGLKDLFLLSKSIELLVMSIEAASNAPATGYVKTSTDRDKLVAARDCVNARLTRPPSLSEIAKLVGLNEYKLKRGFKEMFGSTVFAYLTRQRLELARQHLLDTEKNVAEIAFELGYATPQHFSHAFKKQFGVAPNSVRKNP
jgi:AraC family transcriptional regulator, transcriptional activator of the genes for pyochelin and ferripyochelin receptors